jgi:hypothetical protein
MTQMTEFLSIREAWVKRGRPSCDHPRRSKERYLGADTGDAGCLDCGETWPRTNPPPTRSGKTPNGSTDG